MFDFIYYAFRSLALRDNIIFLLNSLLNFNNIYEMVFW